MMCTREKRTKKGVPEKNDIGFVDTLDVSCSSMKNLDLVSKGLLEFGSRLLMAHTGNKSSWAEQVVLLLALNCCCGSGSSGMGDLGRGLDGG